MRHPVSSSFLSPPKTFSFALPLSLHTLMQSSAYVTSLLFAACQEISRVGGYTMERYVYAVCVCVCVCVRVRVRVRVCVCVCVVLMC